MTEKPEEDTPPIEFDQTPTRINKTVKSSKPPKKALKIEKILLAVLVAVLLGFVLALAVNSVLNMTKDKSQEETSLDQLKENYGRITVANSKAIPYNSNVSIETADVNQKALAEGSEMTTPAGIVFTNGKKDNGNRVIVETYVDFSTFKSRDFFVMNNQLLKSSIESGKIELRVHPLPYINALSAYSSEALAITAVSQPDLAWDFMYEIIKLSTETDSGGIDPTDTLTRIETIADKLELTEVTTGAIKNGMFSSWWLSLGSETILSGAATPLIVIDGEKVNPEEVTINNTADFSKLITPGKP